MPRVEGADQLKKVARLLEENGNSRALKRRIGKAIKSAADPIPREQREVLAAELPKTGGAAETISADAALRITTNYAAAMVTIRDAWPGHNMGRIEAGILRHPLYGNRSHWYNTSVTPGLLRQVVYRHRTSVLLAIGKEMDTLAEKIAREA